MRAIYKIILFFRRIFGLGRIFLSVFLNFKLTKPERLRVFFEKAGGAFIKFGQILALRQDFLSLPYVNELLKLLNKVPEVGFVQMHKVFIGEIRRPIGKFFSEFNEVPVASGSIAQVYFARLYNGDKVAVKIQRPGVREKFESDFLVISFFAGIFDFFRLFSSVSACEVVSDFISWTRRELDFRYEAKNADVIYKHSKEHPETIIPKQYLELTTPKVLVQEFIEGGVPVEKILSGEISRDKMLSMDIDPDVLASYLIKDEMRQYFIDKFFHADPHPANLIFLPQNKLVYLDFGIVGEVKENRMLFLKLLHGVAVKDIDFVSRYLFEFGHENFNKEVKMFLQNDLYRHKVAVKIFTKIKELIFSDFKKEMEEILEPWFEAISNPKASLYEKSSSVALLKLIKKAEEYTVQLPREIILFFRSLSILDMVALRISSEFDMIKALGLFFEEYPLEKVEDLIESGIHEAESGEKITPVTDVDWEFFQEISLIKKERALFAEERMTELIFYYADKYEEIRSMLKSLK